MHTPSPEVLRRVQNIFRVHPASGDQMERYTRLCEESRALAMTFVTNCPESRELSLALTNLEQALAWAHASIEINEPAG